MFGNKSMIYPTIILCMRREGTLSNQQQIDSTGHRSINLVKEGPFDRIRCIPDRYNILLAHLKMALPIPANVQTQKIAKYSRPHQGPNIMMMIACLFQNDESNNAGVYESNCIVLERGLISSH